jgi:hypothetical protein
MGREPSKRRKVR